MLLRGLTTVVYPVSDMEAAKAWYTEVLGQAPYLDRGPYAEFRTGDYQHELGLIDTDALGYLGGEVAQYPLPAPAGTILYWAVDDAQAAVDRLVELGAKPHQEPRDFGTGFIGASVIDPFGNILGVMYNPHYLEVLGDRG